MKKILIVDDHKIIFSGLESKLKEYFSLYFASNSREALKIVMENEIYGAILDVTIGDENGLDLAYNIRKSVHHIFFFSMHKSPINIEQARHDGYDGYFLKDESLELMIKALRQPIKGHFWMTDMVKSLFDKQNFNGDANYERLTPREQQIFRMIAEGLKPREISAKIHISTKTVSVHRENLMRKMGVKDNSEIVHLAIKLEVIDL